MYNRNVYVIQPYTVGTKDRKSLAIVIPAQVVTTIFALNLDKGNSWIILRKVGIPGELPACRNGDL